MQGWLGSEGHCRNIMNPAFAEIGAAFAEGPFGGNPAALYWTFDLGLGPALTAGQILDELLLVGALEVERNNFV